jgi:hypothetical protein
MPEIYIQIFMCFVGYLIMMRLVSGGKAFRSWHGFYVYHMMLLLVLAFIETVSGGAMFGLITVFAP